MKKLTIEEKAAAYDVALERAKECHIDGLSLHQPIKDVIEYIFSELKESGDEKIRKYLIDRIISAYGENSSTPEGIEVKDIIAWLEKQGEPVEINPTEFDTRLQTLIGKFDSLPKEELIGSLSFWLNVVQNDGTYEDKERQGEQKYYGQRKECLDCQFNYAGKCKGSCQMKRDKKNPSDKIEPKFHKGDWLCENELNNYARFIQILETVNVQGKERYRISRDIHNDEDIVEFDFVEKYYHKFDIKDAKDGDVLAAEPIDDYQYPFVAIYKEHGLNFFNSYCFIGFDGKFYEANTGHSTEKIHPATKEQRDLLFQKMKEAGYEWDAELKQLRKIEQKPSQWNISDYRTWQYIVSDILTKKDGIGQYLDDGECKKIAKYMQEEWSNRLGVEQRTIELSKGQDYGIDGLYAAIDILTKTLGKVDGYQTDDGILEHKCAISAVKQLAKQKPATWSEEDEAKRNALIGLVGEIKNQPLKRLEDWDGYISWLKSLRFQKQWKPSEEQMKALHDLNLTGNISYAGQGQELINLYNELKKLKG